MTIGFITPEYPSEKLSKVGGMGTSIKNLVVSLKTQGVTPIIFVVNQDLDEIFKDDGIEVHAIKNKKRALFQWYFNRKDLNKYISNIVAQKNIDLLEAPDWTGITAFMSFNCPLIIRFHGSDAYFCHLEKRKQKSKNQFIEKSAINSADAFIAPTTFAGELSKQLFNIKDKEIKVIHHGLFLEKFSNNNPKAYTSGTILYLGTLIRKKGVFELTKIFNHVVKQNPEAKLILIGNDSGDIKTASKSTWELMKQQFSPEAIKRVDYKGKVPYEAVQGHIMSAHVCVFPTFAETLGMVTIESMALNKPVINTNYGWAQELINHEVNGYLVDPENTKEYASRILELLDNKELTQKIGETARVKVETTFDIKTLVKDNIAYYKSLLS